MSNSNLILWFEQLLFGGASPLPAPPEVESFLFRMEAENIPWMDMVHRGGFTAFPYLVHGDLSYLIDYLEKQWLDGDPPREVDSLQTRAAIRFWNELQCVLAKRNEILPPALPTPSLRDDEILRDLLENATGRGRYAYQSAAFWGEVARRFIRLRRPETLSPLPPLAETQIRQLARVYSVHSAGRGYYVDPLTLHLVHDAEFVNAVHWQSPHLFRLFMADRPAHPLTRCVQAVVEHAVEEVLRGERPSACQRAGSSLDAFFHNIGVIHRAVQPGPQEDTPPKLIDVLQRLLALSHLDGLWEKEVPVLPCATPSTGTQLFYLTEQLRIYEKEKRLWMQTLREEDAGRPLPVHEPGAQRRFLAQGGSGPCRGGLTPWASSINKDERS